MSCLWMEDDEKNEAEIIGTAGLGIDFLGCANSRLWVGQNDTHMYR